MIPVYLLRCGFQWSITGLSYSIIADYVPKEYRARWSTLESIASFGWSGSALLGGKLVRMSGYSTTFAITAVVQFLGVLLFALPIVPLVAKESEIQALVEDQKKKQNTTKEGDENGFVGGQTDDLEEPLLAKGEFASERAEPQEIRPMSNQRVLGNDTFANSLSKSLGNLEHMAKVGSLG